MTTKVRTKPISIVIDGFGTPGDSEGWSGVGFANEIVYSSFSGDFFPLSKNKPAAPRADTMLIAAAIKWYMASTHNFCHQIERLILYALRGCVKTC